MGLFWLYQFVGIIAAMALIFLYCNITKRNYLTFLWKHIRNVILAIVVVMLLISTIAYYSLYTSVHPEVTVVASTASTLAPAEVDLKPCEPSA